MKYTVNLDNLDNLSMTEGNKYIFKKVFTAFCS